MLAAFLSCFSRRLGVVRIVEVWSLASFVISVQDFLSEY